MTKFQPNQIRLEHIQFDSQTLWLHAPFVFNYDESFSHFQNHVAYQQIPFVKWEVIREETEIHNNFFRDFFFFCTWNMKKETKQKRDTKKIFFGGHVLRHSQYYNLYNLTLFDSSAIFFLLQCWMQKKNTKKKYKKKNDEWAWKKSQSIFLLLTIVTVWTT